MLIQKIVVVATRKRCGCQVYTLLHLFISKDFLKNAGNMFFCVKTFQKKLSV